MPETKTWRVKDPSGKYFKVTTPATASQADALAFAKRKWASARGESIQSGAANFSKEFSDVVSDAASRDPEVDYKSGVGLPAELQVKRADNPEEAKAALEKMFGAGNVGQDKGGRFWVKKDGKKIAVFGEQTLATLPKRSATEVISQAPEVVGMTLGGLAGGAVGSVGGPPGAVVGALGGAGIGSTLGKGTDEVAKHLTGTLRKTQEQEKETLKGAFAEGVAGEASGRTLSKLGSYVVRPSDIPWIHVTGDMRTRLAAAQSRGLRQTIDQMTGGETYTLLAAHQQLATYVWGNPAVARNVGILNREFEKKLEQVGISKADIPRIMNEIRTGDISHEKVNANIVSAIEEYKTKLVDIVEKSSADANKVLDSKLSKAREAVGDKAVSADMVATDIRGAKDEFSKAAASRYAVVDQLGGKEPIIDTAPIKEMLKKIIDELPKTQGTEETVSYVRDPKGVLRKVVTPGTPGRILGTQVDSPILSYLTDLGNMPDKISAATAQAVRSHLLQMTDDNNLTHDVAWRHLSRMAGAFDSAFDAAEQAGGQAGATVKALRDANAFYKDNVKKFEELSVNKLVREAGERGAVEPERVISEIAKPGLVARAQRIMELVSPDTRKAIGRSYFDAAMEKASDPDNPDRIIGSKLWRWINQNQEMAKTLWGKDGHARVYDFARQISALDESVTMTSLGPQNLDAAVAAAKTAKANLDAFEKNRFLHDLASPTPEVKDTAISYILQNRGIESLRAGMKAMENKPEVQAEIRQALMKKLLVSAYSPGERDMAKTFDGAAFLKELNEKWGRKYLEEAYGKPMTDDLFHFAEAMEAVTSQPGRRTSIGFVKGAGLLLNPLSHLLTIVNLAIGGHLLSQPWFMRYLAQGARGDGVALNAIDQIVKMTIRQGVVSGSHGEQEAPIERPEGATVH